MCIRDRMKVTQELDAFTTAGFSIVEYLVLPRVLALVLMMPLLCLYADFVGVLGGAAIGVGMLDLSWTTYVQETARAVRLGDTAGGLFKSCLLYTSDAADERSSVDLG